MKKVNYALVLGKFMDFHKGHIFLIKEAMKMADHVTVLVCEGVNDRTSLVDRTNWIHDTFGNDITINVVNCYDNFLPEDGESDKGISKKWAIYLDVKYPNLDLVVGSEAYIGYMAEVGNFQGATIDIGRWNWPCSSTSVNEGSDECYRSPASKLTKSIRVGFIGPESTGKSTAAGFVCDYFVEEQARSMMSDDHYDLNDLERFALAQQLEVLNALNGCGHTTLVVDSTAITTWVYSEFKFGRVSPVVKAIAESEPINHYLLFSPEVPMVQDGTRLQDQDSREAAFDAYKVILKRLGKEYTVITGTDYSQRVDQVKSKLKELKNAR
jgi:HTH-type transcriptional repressor of NAD biosynthesis genes